MKWSVKAPANIALIKYMGKAPGNQNIPLNGSLSYTLPELLTAVEVERHTTAMPHDVWEPLQTEKGFIPYAFNEAAQTRFLKHFAFIKQQFNCTDTFTVRSANNFPHATGLASSASSFAALTQAAVQACAACTNTGVPSIQTQAELSRLGSGSSCRSFFTPWAIWDSTQVGEISLPYPELIHQVVLIEQTEKKVSSSEAHRRVSRLADFPQRAKRVEENLDALLKALEACAWDEAYDITFREFQDMHALFHASTPSFTYMTEKSHAVLHFLQSEWKKMGDGPLITMDAGPNVHLLYRTDQSSLAKQLKHTLMEQDYHVL